MSIRERDACGIGFVADRLGRASRDVVEAALEALRRVRHRGAVAADGRSGDGAGLLVPIPRELFRSPGVGMLFLPPDGVDPSRELVERGLGRERVEVDGWRTVPVEPEALGETARRTMPVVAQVLFRRPDGEEDPERRAFRTRKRIEAAARRAGLSLYVASMSFATVTYKALCAADQLAAFFPDLSDPLFTAPLALFHQRYSTNTSPSWERAQPFRLLCHNGEINTIQGNVLSMRGRGTDLGGISLGSAETLCPVLDENGSDSSMLDNAAEVLVRAGRSLPHALSMLVPEAWEEDGDMDPALRDFYRYHACLTEPWDGPAALVFGDGRIAGARLDRNGLRPLRFAICEDGLVYCGSEAGLVDLAGRGQVRRGKLGPGQMLVVDTAFGEVLEDGQLDAELARRRPYGDWLATHLAVGGVGEPVAPPEQDPARRQVAFGYTKEELTAVLRPMATSGHEPTSSMGDDTAAAPLANRPRPVFGYLKQRFAQVTNPPIDHRHERVVMSLTTRIGPRGPLLRDRPDSAALIELPSFLLYPSGLERLAAGPWRAVELDATFPVEEGPEGLGRACRRLASEAEGMVRRGAGVVVVSDAGVGPARAPVPSVLATGAVHHRLVGAGLRSRTSIVASTGEAREVHHFACLLGYGADAVVPWLALESIAALCAGGRIGGDAPSAEDAQERFRHAVEEGVLKVMSKMGIATIDAYRGGQLFEALGLGADVIGLCLPETPSPMGGVTLADLGADGLELHARAFGPTPVLTNPGFLKHHPNGEYHATNPEVVAALHEAVGLRERSSGDAYRRFAELVNGRPPAEPRDLLEPVPAGRSVPVEEVEPASSIVLRFSAGGMSHGALSAEAHETLAAGLNAIGSRSNGGEGGEDPARYRTERNSRIKQVASARFGVTPEYCAFAEELQIKMAQGSKPGEGGQLPGHKVTAEIARLRHTRPGIPLISPPPHHDIYSIEDLAQLIYDLKQVNPRADVSVKLVSTSGVGVIAAGVAKALADVVHIAGADGGTGASPLSSIKNAGLPWEVGLAEAQAELSRSGLRGRVRLRVDGGLKTGRDVVMAALLGADQFSFGTAALLAEGCIMVRACHRDTCPTGIATQRPELRARFAGTPERVAAYFLSVAEEVRGILASLGLRSLEEAVGRTDLVRPRETGHRRADALRVPLPDTRGAGPRRFVSSEPVQRPASPLGDRLVEDGLGAIRDGGFRELAYRIGNGDRAVGAGLSGEIARAFGSQPPPGRIRAHFRGQAGQSFAAFLVSGVELRLVGEANDYVGKGMAGGRIVIRPPENDQGDPVLLGNTVLYGATGGELFCAGRAGERFAVRNSGAVAVVEGVGDHACEYMTAGTVVVLGPVGRNLGAGMSGGACFVQDPDGGLAGRVNPDLVLTRRPSGDELDVLRGLLERHLDLTGSARAFTLLASDESLSEEFRLVVPRDAGAAAGLGPGLAAPWEGAPVGVPSAGR